MHSLSTRDRGRTVFLVLLAVLAVAFLLLSLHVIPAAAMTTALGGVSTASVFIPVVPKTPDQLTQIATPGNARQRAFRAPLYDTQLYTSGATTRLSFFGAINADKTMSNLRGNGGTFPNGVYFEPLFMGVDILADASLAGASTEVGVLDDIQKLVLVSRATATITVGDVTLPQIPISFLHGSGGAIGVAAGTWTAPNGVQVGNNGVQDSGYCVAGSFIISPAMPFAVVIDFAAAQTLNSGNTNIRFWLDGNWHLPVG